MKKLLLLIPFLAVLTACDKAKESAAAPAPATEQAQPAQVAEKAVAESTTEAKPANEEVLDAETLKVFRQGFVPNFIKNCVESVLPKDANEDVRKQAEGACTCAAENVVAEIKTKQDIVDLLAQNPKWLERIGQIAQQCATQK